MTADILALADRLGARRHLADAGQADPDGAWQPTLVWHGCAAGRKVDDVRGDFPVATGEPLVTRSGRKAGLEAADDNG